MHVSVSQAVGIAAFADLGDVPYYLCAVLCGLYHALAQPLESYFHQQLKAARAIGGAASAAPSEAVVQVRRPQKHHGALGGNGAHMQQAGSRPTAVRAADGMIGFFEQASQ